jgi:hypothetical protein
MPFSEHHVLSLASNFAHAYFLQAAQADGVFTLPVSRLYGIIDSIGPPGDIISVDGGPTAERGILSLVTLLPGQRGSK